MHTTEINIIIDAANACPKLERLSMSTMCTQAKIDKLIKTRPNVECDIITFLE